VTWTQVLPYIGSGALGGIVTFGLNWAREQRRVADAYRAPQRHAIGEILAAGMSYSSAVSGAARWQTSSRRHGNATPKPCKR
jgi:hypothetical protein